MQEAIRLDAIDLQILDLLRRDGRRPVTELAARVNLTAAPAKRRIERLERLGIIAGYTVVLDHSRLGPSLEAFTQLQIAGDADPQRVMEAALEHEEVEECFTTAGDPDVLLHVRVDDVAHLQRLVKELRRTGMVTGTKTMIVLERRGRGRWS
jgi:Lrp/AsnC family transcriptional regulator, leucine-responsive regulatory protein